MGVKLRKKAVSNGRMALFLNMIHENQRKKDYLKLYIFKRAKNPVETQHNQEQAALSNNKALRVLIRLDSIDIATLDFTKLVRLQRDHERYGETVSGWFFIQQIDQYLHGSSSSTWWVDLMRIEIPTLTSVSKPTDNTGYLLNPLGEYIYYSQKMDESFCHQHNIIQSI